MTETSGLAERRAVHVSIGGFIVQLAAFITLLGVSLASGSGAILLAAGLAAFGLPIWFCLLLTFNQLRRVRAEELETEELRRARDAGQSTAIFDIAEDELHMERNRLRWLVRFLLPAVTILLSATTILYHGFYGALPWGWPWNVDAAFGPGGVPHASNPMMMMWFMAGCGFVSFLFARYSITLAKLPHLRLLHSGASCMVATSLACLILFVAMMANSIPWVEPLVAYLMRLGLLVLGIELLFNFILDFYRPRSAEFIPRPSFDSRLMGLISEPGDIARSIANAINYQFGFEVSTTWFYQLLQRWLLPLMVLTVILVVLLSSVVIVDAEEQVIVERFGRPWKTNALLEPGVHLKLPWPVDVVRRVPVREVQEAIIGEADSTADEEGGAILWTKQHTYVPELMLLVASRRSEDVADFELPEDAPPEDEIGRRVAASLVMVSIPIEYRIKDLQAYLYNYDQPEQVMESVVYQIVSDYEASVDLDDLIGPGRKELNEELQAMFQQRIDELDLGIELAFVGVRGAHPPAQAKVAEAFQNVIAAESNKSTTINGALVERNKKLTKAAGSVARAEALAEAISAARAIETSENPDPNKLAAAQREVDALLLGDPERGVPPVSGNASALISFARRDASEMISAAAVKASAFSAETAAYQASPLLFKTRKWLEVFEQLDFVRKYLIVGPKDRVIVIWDENQPAGLDTVLDKSLNQE